MAEALAEASEERSWRVVDRIPRPVASSKLDGVERASKQAALQHNITSDVLSSLDASPCRRARHVSHQHGSC